MQIHLILALLMACAGNTEATSPPSPVPEAVEQSPPATKTAVIKGSHSVPVPDNGKGKCTTKEDSNLDGDLPGIVPGGHQILPGERTWEIACWNQAEDALSVAVRYAGVATEDLSVRLANDVEGSAETQNPSDTAAEEDVLAGSPAHAEVQSLTWLGLPSKRHTRAAVRGDQMFLATVIGPNVSAETASDWLDQVSFDQLK